MKLYLLDAGIGSVTDILWFVAIILLGVIIVEWFVLMFFSLGNPGKLFLHSLIVNLVSTILGYVLAEPLSSIGDKDSNGLFSWFVFLVVSIIIEGVLLQILNRQQPVKKIWLAAIAMNIVSYLILYFLFRGKS